MKAPLQRLKNLEGSTKKITSKICMHKQNLYIYIIYTYFLEPFIISLVVTSKLKRHPASTRNAR